MPRHGKNKEVSRGDVEECLAILAAIIARDGPYQLIPLFMRLEDELERLDKEDRAYERALKGSTKHRAIRYRRICS